VELHGPSVREVGARRDTTNARRGGAGPAAAAACGGAANGYSGAAAVPPTEPDELRHLPALHYALSAVLVLASAATLGPVAAGWYALAHPEAHANPRTGEALAPPSAGMWVFLVLGSAVILYGIVLAAAVAATGRAIARRRSHTFCIVTSVLATFFFPLGTLLGFHTINALTTHASRAAFGLLRPDPGADPSA
jgi:hypothetical protein